MTKNGLRDLLLAAAVFFAALATVSTLLASAVRADTGFGISTPNGVAAADRKYGHVDVTRKYFGGLPKAIPNRSSVVSFKADAAGVVNGRYDGYLRNWFRNLPNGPTIWWSYYHEPEDNFTTQSRVNLYKRAWAHITHIERSTPTNGNLRATFIHTMHSVWTGTWGRHYPGDSVIDVLGFDGKIKNWHGRYIPARKHYAEARAIANRHNKPWGLAEMGATILAGHNAADRARWMRQTAHWMSDVNARFCVWWDQRLTSTKAGDFRLQDAPSIRAMRWTMTGWQR